jgi:cytochrome P450
MLEQLLIDRRRQPKDDLMTLLINSEIEGRPLTHEELMGTCHLLFIAGLDTVTDSLSCFYAFLATHPEHRRRLVEDPDTIPSAIEEMLRYESPVTMVLPRVVTQETELSGCPVHPGDKIIALLGSANNDESVVDNPEEVDFDRTGIRHYAFGGGVHRCLGSNLARLELRVSLREWHRRIPEYHIADGVELQYAALLRQVEHLPLVFDKVVG